MTNTEAPATTATYQIRYTRTSVHIEGFAPQTTGGGVDTGKGYVSYSASSHCPTLSRGSVRMGVAVLGVRDDETDEVVRRAEWSTAREVLDAARLYARTHGGSRICAKCEQAAELAIAAEAPAIDRDALEAERAQLLARLAEVEALLA